MILLLILSLDACGTAAPLTKSVETGRNMDEGWVHSSKGSLEVTVTGWAMCPEIPILKPAPSASECAIFGDRAFKEVIK